MAVYHLCRICLTEGTDSESMQSLFDDSKWCDEIVRKIEECGGIELKPHEEYPKRICDQCLQSLDVSYKFRTMCQASEHALLDAIIKSELKSEVHEDSNTTDDQKPIEETEIFFDLHTEIIDGEEVDLDMLTTNLHDEESAEDWCASVSDISSESEFRYEKTNKKKSLKPAPKKPAPKKKRGRPRLRSLDITALSAKSRSERRKAVEIPDQIMCEVCGNIYSNRSKLSMHMRRHLSEKPYECEICKKTFASPSEIRRHMRVHTGEKPFICKFCGRTFADRSTNIKHERIHTQERPFVCNTCGKTFTYSNVLKNHLLTHTGEKPYSCSPCNKTFSRKHQLGQHYATLTHQHTMQNRTVANSVLNEEEIIIVKTSHENLVYQSSETFDDNN